MTHLQSCFFANLNLLLFCRSCCCRHRPLGSLSNDGDGYENVTQKLNSRCFKFYRAYSISFNSSNGGHFFFLELNTKRFYQRCGKEKESSCLMLTSCTKRKISHFHVVVVYQQQINVQKRAMHVQSCCFANLKPIAFRPFSLLSSSLLKLPNS